MAEKKKGKMTMSQWIAFIVVLGILLVVLITVVSNLIFKLKQDWDGYAEDLKTAYQYYKVEDVQYEDEIYKIFLPSDTYKKMSADQKLEYCKNIYQSTRNLASKHKILRSHEDIIMRFYSGGERVAEYVAGDLVVYK